jgi:hypothetical protein
MQAIRSIQAVCILCAGVFLASALPASLARAQSGSVTVSTDKMQYQVGESVRICYTVAGPGPITITDILADGTRQQLFQGVDDGTGYCFNGSITPPVGTECLAFESISEAGNGSSRTCFQVNSVGPVTSGADCGQITVLNSRIVTPDSRTAESCFFQAYSQCNPATLLVSLNGVDAGIRHGFSLSGFSANCTISDNQQHFVVPRPPQPGTTVDCAGLIQTPDGGLLFQSCGGNDVAVPAGS